jgi:hypothetical protein
MTAPMPQPWSPSDPAALTVLADPHRVVAFLGAGMLVPCGLPDAAGLTAVLRASDLAKGVEFADDPNLQETAHRIVKASGLLDLQQLVAREISRASTRAAPPETYRELAGLPSRWIVTFNYDTLMERAARDAGRPVRSVTWRDGDHLDELRVNYVDTMDKGEELVVLHVHGSVDDPSSIAVERSGYQQAADSQPMQRLLTALFGGHRGVWLGTALDEPWVLALLTALSTGALQHCYIGDEASVDAVRTGRGQLAGGMHGMAFDAFPTQRFEHLPEFCRWLVNKQGVTSAPLRSGAGRSDPAPGVGDPRVIVADWGPEWTRKALDALAAAVPVEFAALKDALDERSIEDLVSVAPDWMDRGSWQLWVAAARFAEEHGNWTLAADAWERAAGRPDADRGRCLTGAAAAADLGGADARAADLTAAAAQADPDHPRVKLHIAGGIHDPSEKLAVVSQLFSEDGDVGAIARCHAVVCCLLLDRADEAQAHLEAAERAAPDLKQLRICRINLAVHRGRTAMASNGRVDAVRLQAAKEDALALRDELHRQRRFEESCRLLMLAADATAVQGELEDAATLLRTARQEEQSSRDQRIVLADAALRAQAHPEALALLDGLDGRDVSAMRAQALLRTGDPPAQHAAWDELSGLLDDQDSEAHVRDRCAQILLMASWQIDGVEFPERASAAVAHAGDTHSATVARAFYEHRRGDAETARTLLRAHEPHSWAFEAELQLALWDDDVDETLRLADRVLAVTADPHMRLLCAVRLADAGQRDRCREIAAAIAQDETLPTRDRAEAFAALVDVVVEREGDHREGLDWLERWADAIPDDRRHVWGRIQSMLRLGLHNDAIALLLCTSTPIESRAEAQLAAQAYLLMPDRVDGLRRLADLIDSLPHEDAWLRQRAFTGLLGAGDGVPIDLTERLSLPDSVEPPGESLSWEEVIERLRERHEHVDAVVEEVLAGKGAVSKLAAVAGLQLTVAWHGLPVKPAGFGRAEWAEHEVAAARQALVRGAAADPTALVALTLMPDDVAKTARRRVLEPLRVAQSAVDDVVAAAVGGAGTGKSLVLDPADGQPVALEDTPEQLKARRDALAAVRDLVVDQRAEPDVRPEQPTPLDTFLTRQPGLDPGRALAGSVAVALRTSRPLYADDRVTRLIAAQLGVPTFGSAALLTALAAVNALTSARAAEAMAALRAAGYAGVPALDGELERLCMDPAHREELQAFIADRLLWACGGLEHFLRVFEVLHRLYERDPDGFPAAAQDVLCWASDASSHDPELPALTRDRDELVPEILALLAMLATRVRRATGAFFPELYRQLERFATSRTGSRRGEVIEVAARWMREHYGGISIQAFVQLPLWHQMQIMGVNPDAPQPHGFAPYVLERVLGALPPPPRRKTEPTVPWVGARRRR